jgi:hypothetical protein
MNHNFYKDRYKATQLSVENIKIVEIRELSHLFKVKENFNTNGPIKIQDIVESVDDTIEEEYLHYVIIYHDNSCNTEKLKSLIDEYKKEAICVIGCSNQTETSSSFSEIKNSFDLYCSHPCSQEDLENLLDLLLSVQTGYTHGFPEDIKDFRQTETYNFFSIKYSTCSNMNELSKTFTKLIYENNNNSESCSFRKRYYLSIFCNEDKSNSEKVDNFLRNYEYKNDETLMYTMVEDNSFDNPKLIVLCS